MKIKTKYSIMILFICLILFTPFQISLYKDGGTKTITALTYQIIVWNNLENKKGIEIHLFPNNFHNLEFYTK